MSSQTPPSDSVSPFPSALARILRGDPPTEEDLAEEAAVGGAFAYTPDALPQEPPDWRDAEIARLRAERDAAVAIVDLAWKDLEKDFHLACYGDFSPSQRALIDAIKAFRKNHG